MHSLPSWILLSRGGDACSYGTGEKLFAFRGSHCINSYLRLGFRESLLATRSKVPEFSLSMKAGGSCISCSCSHHPLGGQCCNEPLEPKITRERDCSENAEQPFDYGLCAACCMAREAR